MATSPKPNLYLLKTLLPLSLSLTNTHILHLNRLLSSTTHLDAFLSTLHYTLTLLSTLPPYAPAAALAALISRARTTLRLTGLISIWAAALELWSAPPRDAVLRAIAWAQTGAGAVFQALENVALLGETGVLRVREGTRRVLWRWSGLAWMAWVGLEAARLGTEWALEKRVVGGKGEGVGWKGDGKEGERIEGEEASEEKARRELRHTKWWRQAVVTGAFLPLTLHSSVDEGVLGERWVGALGLVAGGMALRQAWRETA